MKKFTVVKIDDYSFTDVDSFTTEDNAFDLRDRLSRESTDDSVYLVYIDDYSERNSEGVTKEEKSHHTHFRDIDWGQIDRQFLDQVYGNIDDTVRAKPWW